MEPKAPKPLISKVSQNLKIFNRKSVCSWGPQQTFTLLGFLGFASIYAMRVNLSLAIVSMVNHTAIANHKVLTETDVCPEPLKDNSSTPTPTSTQNGEFNWDEYQQGIILGSFYWGYVVTQIPGGRLAELFGAKKLFGFGILSSSTLTILAPFATRKSDKLLILSRFVMGLGEAVTFPAMHSMLAERALPSERSRMATNIFSGAQFGSILTLPLTGILCQYEFDGGWPTAFYVLGSLGLIWFAFWMALVTDHRQEVLPESTTKLSKNKQPVPWRAMASSKPVWAIVAANFGYSWGYYTLMTELPTYFKNILHFNMKENSLISALPYLAMWLLSVTFSIVADKLIKHTSLQVTTIRKIFNSIGQYGPGFALIGVGYIGCHTGLAVSLLTLAVGLSGACYSGFQVNFVEIAPPFAGTLFGIANSLASISGFAAPYVVGVLLNGQQTIGQWRLVFLIASAVYFFCNSVFIIYGSSSIQPWARQENVKDESNKTPIHQDA